MWFLFLKYLSAQVSLFFFLPILLAYKIRSCQIISSLNLRLRERKSDCCWRSKFPLIICFLNQLLISFLILIFYVYVLLQIYRRLLWLMVFIMFMFFFPFFFVFVKESYLWDPSVIHENCLATFGPTVLGMSFSFCQKKAWIIREIKINFMD